MIVHVCKFYPAGIVFAGSNNEEYLDLACECGIVERKKVLRK